MTDYETRIIRGWRGAMEDAAVEIKALIWTSPARTVYRDGVEVPHFDDAMGRPIWFTRVFGQERVAASCELSRLRNVQRRINYRERTPDQQERDSMRRRKRYLLTKHGERTPDQRKQDSIRRHEEYLLRRSKRSEAEHAIELATSRERRSLRSDEQRRHAANMSRLWRLKNLELSKAIAKRARAKCKDKARERRRLHRQENIEAIRVSEREKRFAQAEKRRALACLPGEGEELTISPSLVPD